MPGNLIVVGVSDRTSTVEKRELLALGSPQAGALTVSTETRPEIDEALVLSTRKRTELYAVARDAQLGKAVLREQLVQLAGPLEPDEVEVANGRHAAEHLMRVAAGLESSVPGEFEILDQLRRAAELAHERGASSHVLGRLVQHAVAAGRRVREATEITRRKYSPSSAAVDLACRFTLAGDAGARALVLGNWDTGAGVARGLRANGFDVRLAARHRSARATRLANDIGATTVELGQPLFQALAEADVVVSCTGAPQRLVPSETLVELSETRAGRELLVIDLATPRDFDPEAKSIRGVRHYDLDDLRGVVSATIAQRRSAVQAAEAVALEEADRFWRSMSALGVVELHRERRWAVLEALRGLASRLVLARSPNPG